MDHSHHHHHHHPHQHHPHPHHHRLPAGTYSTVRLLPAHAVSATSGGYYGEHYRHIAGSGGGGPGPGAGPGGGGGGIHLIPAGTSSPSSAAAYQLYHARAAAAAAAAHYAATVNPSKMSKGIYGQQVVVLNSQESKGEKESSSINSWFTWKRKSKTQTEKVTTVASVAARGVHTCGQQAYQQQHQNHTEYLSGKSAVPASLARLFAHPSGSSNQNRTVGSVKAAGKVPTSSTPCICSGLTESTFMAPAYFDEDDRKLEAAAKQRRKSVDEQKNRSSSKSTAEAVVSTSSKSKTLRAIKSRATTAGQSGKEQNGGGTLRAIRSTGSLLIEANSEKSLRHREQQNGNSINRSLLLPPLNQATSCDHLLMDYHNHHQKSSNHSATVNNNTANRKSILECEVNAYELLKPPPTSKNYGGKMMKSATIAVKSSRKSQASNHSHYEVIGGPSTKTTSSASVSMRRSSGGVGKEGEKHPSIRGIFDPANSIRIAGQSVYSSFSFEDDATSELVLVEEEPKKTSLRAGSSRRSQVEVISRTRRQSIVSSLSRSKSTTSLSDWSFSDTNSTSNQVGTVELSPPPPSSSPKVANFHSILIEPEPDYDMDESTEDHHHHHHPLHHHHLSTKSMDRLDRISGEPANLSKTLTSTSSRNRRRSTSVTRPKGNPPPPPSSEATATTITKPPPPPPPPPPANFFDTPPSSGSSPLSLSAISLSGGGGLKSITANRIVPNKIHIAPADTLSFQNELKEKLNQGVKSILKKTTMTTPVVVTSNGDDNLSSTLENGSTTINTDSMESTTITTTTDSTITTTTPEGSSVEKRIHVFDLLSTSMESSLNTLNSSNKPKKHVHFRMKQGSSAAAAAAARNIEPVNSTTTTTSNTSATPVNTVISRSRSASHLLSITETIHESEENAGGGDGEAASFYDDVALPSKDSLTVTAESVLSSSRSFDDISIVSISSTASLRLRNRSSGSAYQEEKNKKRRSLITGSGNHPRSNGNVGSNNQDRQTHRYRPHQRSQQFDDDEDEEDELDIDSFSDDDVQEESTTTTATNRSFQKRSQRSQLAANHHFDVRSSPTPPPIPARRINNHSNSTAANISSSTTSIGEDEVEEVNTAAELEEKKNSTSSFGRALRSSYSSGSVRSLLARKLTRGSRQEGKSAGSKLSNLFSVGKSSSAISTATASNDVLDDDDEQADEHIYEELDSIFADKKKLKAKITKKTAVKENSSSSLFGARISRAEILDYLHDARGRLLSTSNGSSSSRMIISEPVVNDNEEEEVEVEEVEEIEEDEEEEEIDEEEEDELECRLKIITDLNSINTTDSGNGSFVDSVLEGINSSLGAAAASSTTGSFFIPGVGKSRMRKAAAAAMRANNNRQSLTTNTINEGDQQKVNSSGRKLVNSTNSNTSNSTTTTTSTTVIVNRRNRVSNVSNSSSESCATSSGVSGVSSSLSDEVEDDEEELAINSNSSSSLGSMGNEEGGSGKGGNSSSSSASCYYGTCGSGSGGAAGLTEVSTGITPIITTTTATNGNFSALERNDSGVGVEMMITSTPKQSISKTSKTCLQVCVDCDLESMEVVVVTSGEEKKTKSLTTNFICPRCTKRRNERKEIICEIVDTELKYGRDLKIIAAEFARPIGVAGLLTAGQLEDIFLNLDELIEVNEHFAGRLQDALEEAYEREDEDLTTVSIGQLFSECLLARISVFEQYCIRQGSASLLLNQLEKEKELLRIFLRVSQMENTLLRRMNLRSFLVVPVQRVTKYPLLLNRLQKVTPPKKQHQQQQCEREALREAQAKLEFHLESINQRTRGEGITGATSRIWRRISNLSSASIRSRVGGGGVGGSGSYGGDSAAYMDDFGYVRLKKTALDQLKWPKEETRFDLIGKISYMVEKKTSGGTTSSETINNISSSSSNSQTSASRDLNSSTYHHQSLFNLSTAASTTTSSSSSGNTSHNSSNSFWSRTLKFTTASGILVTLSPSTTVAEGDTSVHFSRSTTSFFQEVMNSSPSNSEPNSLTLYQDDQNSADLGESLPNNTSSSSRSPFTFNSASRRANSKSPNRGGQLGSKVFSSQGPTSTANQGIKEAVLLLFKEKSGRYVLCRSLNLAMCVVAAAAEVDGDELFEIHELESKESLLLKGETHSETKEWLEQLRLHSSGLGNWRRRRNALPNIMLGSVVELQQQPQLF